MLTSQVYCATPVVGICSCHFEDKMIEKLIVHLTRSGENTPLYFYPHMDHRLKYLPKGCLYLLMLSVFHIMQPFQHEKVRNLQYLTFFWLIFAICKGRQIKTIIVYTWPYLASSLNVHTRLWRLTLGSRFSCPPANVRCQSPVPVFFLLLFVHLALLNGA